MGAIRGSIARAAAALGYYVGRRPPTTDRLDDYLRQLLEARRVDCVLDVGAHRGEYGQLLRRIGFRGRIVSFEPVPESFRALGAARAHDPAWRAYDCALGSREGQATMHVAAGTNLSSLLPANAYGREQFGDAMAVARATPVRVRRLDAVFDECVAGLAAPRVLLKVDTQGYDLEVVRGAGARLEQVEAVQLEAAFQPMYDGAPDFPSLVAELRAHGLELGGIFPVAYARDLRLVEADCLFVR